MRFLIQLFHLRARISYELAALPCEIIETTLARAINKRVLRNVSAWRAGRRRHGNKAVAKQTGTAHCEFAADRNLHVIEDSQRHVHARSVLDQTRATCDATDLGAGEQNIRIRNQPARVRETNGELVIGFNALSKTAELH